MTYTSVRDGDEALMLDLVVDWAYLESQMDQGDLVDGPGFWHAVAKMCWAAGLGASEHPEEGAVLFGLFPEYRAIQEAMLPSSSPVRGLSLEEYLRPARQDRIVELHKQGVSHDAIGRAVGLSPDTVRQALKKLGHAPGNRRRVSETEIERAVEMRKRGASLRVIGEELGHSHQTVSRALRKVREADDSREGMAA